MQPGSKKWAVSPAAARSIPPERPLGLYQHGRQLFGWWMVEHMYAWHFACVGVALDRV